VTEGNLSARAKTSPRTTLFARYHTQTGLESKVVVHDEEQESNSPLNGSTAGVPMARTTIPNTSMLTQQEFFSPINHFDYQLSFVLSSILAYGSSLLVIYYSLFFNIIMRHIL
jgi:hypothetical protein